MCIRDRVKSISSAQNVADVLLTKAAGELSGGQGGGFSPEKDEEEIPTEEYSLYIYQSQASGGSRHDIAVFRNEEGIQVTMGMLGDIILSPSDRAGLDENAVMDQMLLLRYCTKAIDPVTGDKNTEYTNWYYGKPSYMGTVLTEFKIEKVEEDKNLIRITVTLENVKTHFSPLTVSRIVKCRNMEAQNINVTEI